MGPGKAHIGEGDAKDGPGKAHIGAKNAVTGPKKAVACQEEVHIREMFTPKTASHILKLQENLGTWTAFGRSDVQKVLELGPRRSSELLREMASQGIIEPVSGHGKGKYRFLHPRM